MASLIRYSILLFALVALLSSSAVFGQKRTGNKYVTAMVTDGKGLVTWYLSPGPPGGARLSYTDFSYATFSHAGKFWTNNEYAAPTTNKVLLTDGVVTKIDDTIRCVWSNKSGANFIQDVYPVEFEKSGQIVIRLKVKNISGSPYQVATQYLLDTEIDDNDKASVLTRFGYSPNWRQHNNTTGGVPSFFIAFQKDLPAAPTFNPGISGQGYTDHATLGLKKPAQMTIGGWFEMSSVIWGPPSIPSAKYTDSGILFEWDSEPVQPNETREIGSFSYGIGEFFICNGKVFGIFFYPSKLRWSTAKNDYLGNPFDVEAYIFNTDASTAITTMSMTLEVDPNHFSIIGPTPVANATRHTITPNPGYIPPLDVKLLAWTLKAKKQVACTGDVRCELMITGNTSLGPPTFAADCLPPIILECAERDTIAPIVDMITGSGKQDTSFFTHDNTVRDLGLKSITWSTHPNLTVNLVTPVVGCDKNPHEIRVHQIDSTIPACIDFTFEDCAGNITLRQQCFIARPVAIVPDKLAPRFEIVDRLYSYDGSVCNSRLDSILVRDDDKDDKYLSKIELTPGYPARNMQMNLGTFSVGSLQHRFSVSVLDSLMDGAISIRATDKAGNFADTVITYCTIPDTQKPQVVIDPYNNGVWRVHVYDIQPWDRGIDQIIVNQTKNVTLPNLAGSQYQWKREYDFDITVTDTLFASAYCVIAIDSVKNTSAPNCTDNPIKPDIWAPNITFTPSGTTTAAGTVTVDDIHIVGGKVTGWDTGIDSVWMDGFGMTVGGRTDLANIKYYPIGTDTMRVPAFPFWVTDTLSTDTACLTIHATDARNLASKTYCWPLNSDDNPPTIVTINPPTQIQLDLAVLDTNVSDRGLQLVQLENATNFNPFAVTANGQKKIDVRLGVTTSGKSAWGKLTAQDVWGAMSPDTTVRSNHRSEVVVWIWMQNLYMPKSVLVRDTQPLRIPIYFDTTDTAPLAMKNITSYAFTINMQGDLGIRFKSVDVVGTASAGWTVTPTVSGPSVSIMGTHGAAPALSDSKLPMLYLVLEADVNENTQNTLLAVDQQSVIYNGDRDTLVKGFNATALLHAPYGQLSNTNVVVAGTCSPGLQTDSRGSSIVSISSPNPNPFNSETSFEYTLPEAGTIEIAVYSALGEKIKTLVTGDQSAGRHTVSLPAAGMLQGTYYVRLETTGKILTRKIILSR